jgi:hypothetical protein
MPLSDVSYFMREHRCQQGVVIRQGFQQTRVDKDVLGGQCESIELRLPVVSASRHT